MNKSCILPLKLTLTASPALFEDDGKVRDSENRNFAFNSLYRGQYSNPSHKIRRLLFKNKDSSSHDYQYSVSGSLGEMKYIFHIDTVDRSKSKDSRRSRNSFVYGLNISTLVLALICPKTKEFEIVRVPISQDKTTVGDLLDLIPAYCHKDSLKRQKYRGICRASNGIEIQNRLLRLIGNVKKNCCKILAGELLVALPRSYSGTECMSLTQRIIGHPIIAPAFVMRKAHVLRKVTSDLQFQKKNDSDSLEKISEDEEIFAVDDKTKKVQRRHISGSKIKQFLLRSIHSAKSA